MIFSVIIPVYNAEKYLDNALRVFTGAKARENNTPEVEVLLIEDGSNDNSPALCDEYAEKYDFIRAFHVGKTGPFKARREGIKRATGEWLIFADSDDELSEETIPSLYEYIRMWEKKNLVPDIIVYNAADYVNRKERLFNFPFEENRIYSDKDKKCFYDIMSSSDALNAMWNKCVRREFVVGSTESFGKIELNHGEDLLQTAEFIDKAEKIAYLDKCLYFYRQNSNGLTGNFHREFMPDQECAWKLFDGYVKRWSDLCEDTGKYFEILEKRKTLTCSIGVKSLIYSRLGLAEKKKQLKKIMNMDFYNEYVRGELPEWAPEEDVFVHNLQIGENPYKRLINSAIKHDLKFFVKRILKYGN